MPSADEKRRRKELAEQALSRKWSEQAEQRRAEEERKREEEERRRSQEIETLRPQLDDPALRLSALHRLARSGDPAAASLVEALLAGRGGMVPPHLAASLDLVDPRWPSLNQDAVLLLLAALAADSE